MLDLLFVADLVRDKTRQSLAEFVEAKPKDDRRRLAAVRSGSAAALRGLADRIEPTADAVTG